MPALNLKALFETGQVLVKHLINTSKIGTNPDSTYLELDYYPSSNDPESVANFNMGKAILLAALVKQTNIKILSINSNSDGVSLLSCLYFLEKNLATFLGCKFTGSFDYSFRQQFGLSSSNTDYISGLHPLRDSYYDKLMHQLNEKIIRESMNVIQEFLLQIQFKDELQKTAPNTHKLIIWFDAGINADCTFDEGYTPLMLAVLAKQDVLANYLLKNKKANVLKQNAAGSIASDFALPDSSIYPRLKGYELIQLVGNRNWAQAEQLLLDGVPVDFRSSEGYTPLLRAVELGYAELVTLLLEHGASLNSRNDKRQGVRELTDKPNIL